MMKIGVIIATYNGEKYIAEQIISIVNQTLLPNKIVISDGGSSDATVEVCKKKIAMIKNIQCKIMKSTIQLDVTQNFQKALENCDCEYVFFADQDDLWLPNKIEIFIQAMEETHSSFAFSNAEIVDHNLQKKDYSLWESIGYSQDDIIRVIDKNNIDYINGLLNRNIVTGMCMCLRKDLIKQVLPFCENVLHDKWIAMVAALSTRTVAIDERLVLYRQHSGNVVGTSTNLRRMISNSSTYIQHVVDKEQMIKLLLRRLPIEQEVIKNNFLECIQFQRNRQAFMKGKIGLIWPIMNRKLYKKYEYGRSIIIKDYIMRGLHRV